MEEREIKYHKLCTEDDCYKMVKEDEIERYPTGKIYERSRKCWDCRTKQDKKAINKFRATHKPFKPLNS